MRGLPEEGSAIDTFLRKEGFKCRDQEPDGVEYSLWRYYSKDFKRVDSNVMFRLVIRYMVQIHDDPGGSYDDNHQFFYEDTYLAVFDRQMIDEGGLFAGDKYYDEETESLRKVDKFPLHLGRYGDLQQLLISFGEKSMGAGK